MTDATVPAAIPWYKSTVLRGILTIVVTQVIGRVQSEYHIDTEVLGLGVNEIVTWLMNMLSAAALAYIAHARVTQKTAPAVTATQSQADKVNTSPGASNATDPASPAPDPKPPL